MAFVIAYLGNTDQTNLSLLAYQPLNLIISVLYLYLTLGFADLQKKSISQFSDAVCATLRWDFGGKSGWFKINCDSSFLYLILQFQYIMFQMKTYLLFHVCFKLSMYALSSLSFFCMKGRSSQVCF